MAVTAKDVALLAGTSKSAVSAAISGKSGGTVRMSHATRRRIIEAARQLGYAPNPLAQSLSTGRTGVLGLVLPYADAFVDRNPFCSRIMNGVLDEAIRQRFNMMLFTGDGAGACGAETLDPRVDGLIVVVPSVDNPLVRMSSERFSPCVVVAGWPELPNIPTINADDFHGGWLATEHLIKLGHRKIAMFYNQGEPEGFGPRAEGYKSCLLEHGICCDKDLLIGAGCDWRPGFERMNEILDRPRRQLPTAVFCVNDLCAEGAMRAIRTRGLKVPDDIAIVGFDDTWFAQVTRPALTSVRMPIHQMGLLAVDLLKKLIAGESVENLNTLLPVSLTIRQSCGAPPEMQTAEDIEFLPFDHTYEEIINESQK
ncbi:MAG: LacI family DNA-binding transcriptional regulator [Armatimonadetes bacterium]|nr:LacI family DNA-binding transcriptional regulator [Armatimonadota bacterium]